MFHPSADIDVMHICYVLRDGDNATSDTFHFSIEDSGKIFQPLFIVLASGCLEYDWLDFRCVHPYLHHPSFLCVLTKCLWRSDCGRAITRIRELVQSGTSFDWHVGILNWKTLIELWLGFNHFIEKRFSISNFLWWVEWSCPIINPPSALSTQQSPRKHY